MQAIHDTHRSYDVLHFPLRLPCGDDKVRLYIARGREGGGSRCVSACEFYVCLRNNTLLYRQTFALDWNTRPWQPKTNNRLASEKELREHCVHRAPPRGC
eukprot:1181948-Prorocentrum_minimum.AAC.5